QPALVAKLSRSAPDVVVLDLEDAVPAPNKGEARAAAIDAIVTLGAPEGAPLVAVRVNSVRTSWFDDDVSAVVAAGVGAIVVPKLESIDDVRRLHAAVTAAGATTTRAPGATPLLVAGIETARGVADARTYLADGFAACYFGAEDYVADMGGERTSSNDEVRFARGYVALAARVCGVAALDIVTADIADAERFAREAAEARALGYAGKLCIHPRQVALARDAFTPTEQQVDRARRVLAAWAEANERGVGAIAFEGQLIDEPMATRARAVLSSIN
ncbi:MAG: CoA ester lyase, partial [Actinobacteria bacterium]|nr:CoA ester lyase [Actinomycetota bacterium]